MAKNSNIKMRETNYSEMIGSEDYLRIIFDEHIYIREAVEYMADLIKQKLVSKEDAEVVELGCGPGGILPIVWNKIRNVNLTGIDIDPQFIEHAKKIVKDSPIKIMLADVKFFKHPTPVDIFYSSGVHHHIPKGRFTTEYLNNTFQQLRPSGYYLLADEFFAEYETESEREICLVIWYSHVISHALKDNYLYLAEEEAKTMLDDLMEGKGTVGYKTKSQIANVLAMAEDINTSSEKGLFEEARKKSCELLDKIVSESTLAYLNVEKLELSRKDYKICDSIFRSEIKNTGFVIEEVKSFGPIKNIGGMSVYVLKKPE